jgi:hypothetical protein
MAYDYFDWRHPFLTVKAATESDRYFMRRVPMVMKKALLSAAS